MQQAAATERRALHLTKQSIANEEKPNYKGLSMPNEIKLGFDDDLTNTVQSLYFDIDLNKIVETTLSIMTQKLHHGIDFVYFPDAIQIWHMPKSVSIYVVNHAQRPCCKLSGQR